RENVHAALGDDLKWLDVRRAPIEAGEHAHRACESQRYPQLRAQPAPPNPSIRTIQQPSPQSQTLDQLIPQRGRMLAHETFPQATPSLAQTCTSDQPAAFGRDRNLKIVANTRLPAAGNALASCSGPAGSR